MRRAAAAALIFCLLPLTGCGTGFLPRAREVEDVALLRVMGVDAQEDGVAVTVSTGVQSRGADKGDEPPEIFSRAAGTVSGACLAMQSGGDSYLFYGHVSQLLAGEALASRGLDEVLDYVERDIEMRLDAQIYIIKEGTAEAALSAADSDGKSATDRLDALEDDVGLVAGSLSRTVKDVLEGQARNGAAFIPAIRMTGRESDAHLAPAGYAILKDNALAGWALGDAARGTDLLLGRTEADIVEVDAGGGGKTALRLVSAKTGVRPVFDGDRLVGLDLDCAVEANVAQAPPGMDIAEAMGPLGAALTAEVQKRARAVLDLSQGLNADYLGLLRRAGMACPWRWNAIERQGPAAFSALSINLRVNAEIERSYDSKG